jgi:hypothetical protein
MKRIGGWWRLWIVGIALWGVAVLVIAIIAWPPHNEGHKLTEEEMRLLLPQTAQLFAIDFQPINQEPIFVDDARSLKRWEKYAERLPDARPTGPDDAILVSLSNGQELTLRARTTSEQINQVRQDFARVQRLLLWQQRRMNLLWAFLGWLLPCSFILGVGLSFRWVYRGFKKPPPDQTTVI